MAMYRGAGATARKCLRRGHARLTAQGIALDIGTTGRRSSDGIVREIVNLTWRARAN
jgi:hypothetical protein